MDLILYLLILLLAFKSSVTIEIVQIPIQEKTGLVKGIPSSFFLIITENSKIFYIKKFILPCK